MEGSSENASVDSREDTSQQSKLVFSEEEETLIVRMYNLIGERWPLIAGRIPGRTAKEIEKHWTSKYSSSSSENASVDSREETSQDSKLVFSEEEETLIVRMYNLIGERWPLIAGRIPGRTAKEIEKYWTSKYSSSSE